MSGKAPRLLSRWWRDLARGALLASCVWGAGTAAACTVPPTSHPDVEPNSIVTKGDVTAWYAATTSRYPHSVLGDDREPTRLHVVTPETSAQCGLSLTLARPHVFEDLAPRLHDLTGDGTPELVTIRSHERKGAQIAVYQITGTKLSLLAETPYIGTRFRWLAPAGIADLDGDGAIEIAYIDRPHLAKRLRVWRFENGSLAHVADLGGLTNHRIGEDYISGGLRTCAGRPEMILASANWREIIAVSFAGGTFRETSLGPFTGKASIDAKLSCN